MSPGPRSGIAFDDLFWLSLVPFVKTTSRRSPMATYVISVTIAPYESAIAGLGYALVAVIWLIPDRH